MRTRSLLLPLAATLALFAGACSKKADLKSSTSELGKAFPAPVTPAAGQTGGAASAQVAPTEAQDLVQTALAAARADDFASGVMALQAARSKPGGSAEQLMAVQRTLQAMTTDLATRAANGDQKALAQLKAIERTRSQ